MATHPYQNLTTIAFIDGSLTDLQTILTGLDPSVTAIVLDPAQDGIRQMADALAGMSGLDAIHIISHGSIGQLSLGAAQLTQDTLPQYQTQLAAIGNALSITGDLLLYGCNVAQGDAGQAFISALANATGADVAASEDITGVGGDWSLEKSTGHIEAAVLTADYSAALLVESESNDTLATADAATLGTAITGQLSTSTDLDFYSLAVTSAGTLSVAFDVPTNSTYSEYFKLGLYDGSGTLLSLFSTGSDKT